jgi:Flp pilus assembly protein TadG
MLLAPHRRHPFRSGAVAVEAAIVHPVMVFLLLSLIVGGMGVFRYQQVAGQAREAARYAAVHGSDWQKASDKPSPTEEEIIRDAVAPLAAGMDLKNLSVKITWIDRTTAQATPWDQASKDPVSLAKSGDYVTNRVRVTVVYEYWPPILWLGRLELRSVCEFPMSS